MCQLLGMNCNTPTDIGFSFAGFRRRGGMTDSHEDGFGIAFFAIAHRVMAMRAMKMFKMPQPVCVYSMITAPAIYPPLPIWSITILLKP